MTLRTYAAVLLVTLLVTALAVPTAAASQGICLYRDPAPPAVVYNDGSGSISFDWTVTFGANCVSPGLVLDVVPPSGSIIPLNTYPCPLSSPVSGSRTWTVPAGTAAGNYYGRLTLYSDWAVLPTQSIFEDQATVGFLVAGAGRVQICKFNDLDGDGAWDRKSSGDLIDEPGLPNWQFNIEYPKGTVVQTVTTGSGGCTSDIQLPMIPANAGTTTYWISEVPQIGWERTKPKQSDPYPYQLALQSGQVGQVVEFGNWQPARFRFFKYNDLNGNCVHDAGEPPLSGWQFTLTKPYGGTATLATDATGYTSYYSGPVGVYTVEESSLAGDTDCWERTCGDKIFTINVVANSNPDVEVGNWQVGRLRLFKFEDKNGNGVQDSGELPLQGWTFTVRDPNTSAVVASGVTAASGYTNDLKWQMSAKTTYNVTEAAPTGSSGDWERTTPSPGGISDPFAVEVPVSCSGSVKEVIVGNWQPAKFRFFKFNDLNGNGTQDPGEPALENWQFSLTGPGGIAATLATGSSGFTQYYTGPIGAYTVEESAPAGQTGWVRTNGPNPFTINVVAGANPDTIVGNWQPRFKICKFEDLDGDGAWSSGEPWLNGWVFNVTRPDSTTLTVTTGPAGCTDVISGPPGTYTISEVLPSGWIKTTQNGANPFTVDDDNDTVDDVLVGNEQSISISGEIREDLAPWPWTQASWVGPSGQQNVPAWQPGLLMNPLVLQGIDSVQVDLFYGGTKVAQTASGPSGRFEFKNIPYRPNYTITTHDPGPTPPCNTGYPKTGCCIGIDWPGSYVSTVAMSATDTDWATPDDLNLALFAPPAPGHEYGGNLFYKRRPCRIWGIVHPLAGSSFLSIFSTGVGLTVEKRTTAGGPWELFEDISALPGKGLSGLYDCCTICGLYKVESLSAEPQGVRQGCPSYDASYRITAPPPPSGCSWKVVVPCEGHVPHTETVSSSGSVSIEVDLDPGADMRVDFYLEGSDDRPSECYLPVTLTQQDWHDLAQETTGIPGGMVYTKFARAFDRFTFYGMPTKNLIVGYAKTIAFTPTTGGMRALVAFLPQSGPYHKLPISYTNPTSTTAGELGGEVVALMMNIAYNDERLMPRTPGYNLEEFRISSGPFVGQRVGDVLNVANEVLGGDPPTWHGLPDYQTLIDVLKAINSNYQMSSITSFHDRGYLIRTQERGHPASKPPVAPYKP